MRFQKFKLLLFSILFSISAHAQDMAEYTSGWEGKIENSSTFNLKVEIENLGLENATFKISNNKSIINYPFKINDGKQINIPFFLLLSLLLIQFHIFHLFIIFYLLPYI
jgi:hypothetical protein